MTSPQKPLSRIDGGTSLAILFRDGLCYNKQTLTMLFVFLDNPEIFLNFIDVFAGRSVKVPTRKHLQKLKRYSKLYQNFLKASRNIDKTVISARTNRESLYKAVRFFEERVYDPEQFTRSPRRGKLKPK